MTLSVVANIIKRTRIVAIKLHVTYGSGICALETSVSSAEMTMFARTLLMWPKDVSNCAFENAN